MAILQIRKLAPKHMQNDEAGCTARRAHVTCANFSRQGEIVATYNDEVTWLAAATLFTDDLHISAARKELVALLLSGSQGVYAV